MSIFYVYKVYLDMSHDPGQLNLTSSDYEVRPFITRITFMTKLLTPSMMTLDIISLEEKAFKAAWLYDVTSICNSIYFYFDDRTIFTRCVGQVLSYSFILCPTRSPGLNLDI